MSGFRRQRTDFIGVRLRPDEKRELIKMADEVGCTPAELLRARAFDRPPEIWRCAKGHKGCTAAHRDLVNSYRVERHRQEVEQEGLTGGHQSDLDYLKAKGHKIITFADWLRHHVRQEQEA